MLCSIESILVSNRPLQLHQHVPSWLPGDRRRFFYSTNFVIFLLYSLFSCVCWLHKHTYPVSRLLLLVVKIRIKTDSCLCLIGSLLLFLPPSLTFWRPTDDFAHQNQKFISLGFAIYAT